MPGRRLAGGLLVLGVAALASGCGFLGGARADAQDAGASTSPDCPFGVNDASAWVNRMPGPARADARPVIVSAQLTDVRAKAVLEKAETSTASTLVLTVVQSDAAPIPGRLAWRGPVPEVMYQRVEIVCGGKVLRVIEGIERVY